MSGETLPGARGDAEERIVFHVDMDCFYASCERLKEPELDGEPVVVGMGYEPGEGHGAVATASYEARAHGVDSAQPITQALDALPRAADAELDDDGNPADPDVPAVGYYRPVDMEYYKEVSAQVKEILHDCADVVREVSIDEAYLDVTERTAWQTVGDGDDESARTLAEGYARHVKQRIDREVGVTASVGVGPNMSVAKVASDYDKPNGLVVVRPGEVRSFLDPLDIEEVHGVGPVTARELREMDIDTAGDLAAADPHRLGETFGERGRELHRRARGDDDRAVTPTGLPKSLSRESAFTRPTSESEAMREKVRALAADVAERAQSRGALYRTIGIKVVQPPFEVNTRAKSLPGPVDDPGLVESVALELLTEFDGSRVRKLGVRVSNLDFAEGDQASLDGWENATGEAVEETETSPSRSNDPATSTASDGSETNDSDTNDGRTKRTLGDWAADHADSKRRRDADSGERSTESTDGQASLTEFE
ncbi:DNA polymerase IV [Haloprofundus sp. MHR1]|uniref:DNA polymerase Y family protein n=1 Tax=Haloprofundus sp. MHR1 TaxID=2572921 RepID=UPI0010BE90B0|nr:DNA polymerase IV [Haloprofundus sp. MHR1]QCJ48001.1 DNA polymerase IV [Haloprofundus sp. MHR1]